VIPRKPEKSPNSEYAVIVEVEPVAQLRVKWPVWRLISDEMKNHFAQHLAQAPAARLKFIWHSHNDFANDGDAERRQVV
jgi:hypothetical protein